MSSYLMPMWGKDKTAEERRIAICIFDDVAEQCREAVIKYYDTYLPFLLEACNDESPDVRQAAVYGLGVCAEYGGSAIKPLVGEALSRLNVVIRHPNALQPENVMAYDNAVSALGKICHFHRDNIDFSQLYEQSHASKSEGSGANGVTIHYRAEPDSCSIVDAQKLLVLDSGAQYLRFNIRELF